MREPRGHAGDMVPSGRPFDEDVIAIIRDLGAAEDLADVLPHSSRDRVLIEKTVEALHAQLLAVLDHLDDEDVSPEGSET